MPIGISSNPSSTSSLVTARIAVDPDGITDHGGVEPAAAAGTAGGGAEFAAEFPEALLQRSAGFGRERAVPDPGGVGLHDTKHTVDGGRPD